MRSAVMALVIASTLAPPVAAYKVTVTSEPPGAEVWASPLDQPVIYHKGITPCTIELSDEGAPHVVLIRKRGFFHAYRYCEPDVLEFDATLPPLDDPRSWLHLPGIQQYLDRDVERPMTMARYDRETLLGGLVKWLDCFCGWAPDASAFAVSGSGWGDALVEAGLTRNLDATFSDLWWVAVGGEAVLVHRFMTEDEYVHGFTIDAEFTADPRWLVHSFPVDARREAIALWCAVTGESRVVASDEAKTLYCPRPSPDGRLIAFVTEELLDRETAIRVYRGEVPAPPTLVEIVHHDGAGRRALVAGVHRWNDPVFSPDGTHLACVMECGSVTVTPISGGKPRTIIRDEQWWPSEAPIWSPDGTRVAVLSRSGGADSDPGMLMEDAFPAGHGRRVFWASLDGSESGFIRTGRPLRWFDEESLVAVINTWDQGAGRTVARLIVIGLDGSLRRVLVEPQVTRPSVAIRAQHQSFAGDRPGPRRLSIGLAPTLPGGGGAQ